MAKFRVPANNREVIAVPYFAAVADLVEANRRKLDRDDVAIGGLSLRELRALARREVLELAWRNPGAGEWGKADAPLLLTGHQPELAHPGVWVKNFALAGLAKKLGGVGIHLIVDNDTLKSASLRFPVFRDRDPSSVRLESLAFDRIDGGMAYDDREVLDAELFRTFPERAAALRANWGYEPLLPRVWREARRLGDAFTAIRRDRENAWGCRNLELTVSGLSRSEAFGHLARHVLRDLPRFCEVHNFALQTYREANRIRSGSHPAADLAEGEAPFWVRTASGRRERATATSDVRNLRPRALTLTLFARVCLGDFFIHGIGGGKYDEVTDAIIRDYFGIQPPAYQLLSATLHLPLPSFPSTRDDLQLAERRVRDLHWNPQRHLPTGVAKELVERKAALVTPEPTRGEHVARKEWFRELQKATVELRPFVGKEEATAQADLERVRAEVAANEVLHRRDYAWVLFPEDTLRPFLQQFLNL